RGNFLGLAVADTDGAVTVTDDDESGEAEATTTLDDLGDAVDRHDPLDVLVVLGVTALAAVTAAAAVLTLAAIALGALTGAGASTLLSGHQMFLISTIAFTKWLLTGTA